MLTGQAAGPVSPAGAEACGTRHLNADRTLQTFGKIIFTASSVMGVYLLSQRRREIKSVNPAMKYPKNL